MKTTLQVPLSKSLKATSTKVAREYGFSSLQEAVRVFLTQFAKRSVAIRFSQVEPDEILTVKQEKILSKKYLQAKKEIKAGKGYSAKSAGELTSHLRSV